jgi:precorrin-3B synthase
MSAFHRRGACPGLDDPMPTGDGLLARIATIGRTIALATWTGLCAAAEAHGNGIVEITSRGSIQVRGLTPASAQNFAAAAGGLGLAGGGHAVAVDPLAGLAHAKADALALAASLRLALTWAPFAGSLGAKVSVAIDGGGPLHLDALVADVRLRAGLLPGARLHLSVGGDAMSATVLGTVTEERAGEAALAALGVIAQHGAGARARSVLCADGIEAFTSVLADLLVPARTPTLRRRAEPIGLHELDDGRVALGLGLAFGHTDTTALSRLVAAAAELGADGLRTAPGHALLVVGLDQPAAAALREVAARLDFIVDPRDPRRYVAACAGAPVCSSAEMPARAIAPALTAAAAPLLDGSVTLHVSGCAKGCAHAGPAALTVVGTARGCGLVLEGSARDRPSLTVALDSLDLRLAELAAAVAHARRPDERTADVLARLGAARVTTTLG